MVLIINDSCDGVTCDGFTQQQDHLVGMAKNIGCKIDTNNFWWHGGGLFNEMFWKLGEASAVMAGGPVGFNGLL